MRTNDQIPKQTEEVIVVLRFDTPPLGPPEEQLTLAEIDDALGSAAVRSGAGKWTGHECSRDCLKIFLTGPVADRLCDAIYDTVLSLDPVAGSYIIKRYDLDNESVIRL